MFSENGRISEKQVRRMLILPLFAGCIFVLPHAAAMLFGTDMVWGLVIFLVLSLGYGVVLHLVEKHTDYKGLPEEGEGAHKKWIAVIHVLRLSIRLAFYILLAINILEEGQVPFMREGGAENGFHFFVVLPLLGVAFYGAAHSMEKVARTHEMLFWVTFVPFIVMLLFGLREVDWSVWVPEGDLSFRHLFFSALLLLPCVLPLEHYIPLKRKCNAQGGSFMTYGAIVVVLMMVGVLTMMIMGIYGIQGAAGQKLVAIAIMRYIRMPFGVLERFDMLMVWFFMTGCFLLICSTLFFLGNGYRQAFGEKGVYGVMLGALAFSLVLVHRIPAYETGLFLFLWYGICVDIPLSILLPLLEFHMAGRGNAAKQRERKKRRRAGLRGLNMTEKICMWIFMGCFCVVCLTGCESDMQNVEQRDYATILLIEQGEKSSYHIYLGVAKEHNVGEKSQVETVVDFEVSSLEQLQEVYAAQRGKTLSLTHLKVILWNGGQFDSIQKMAPMLYAMDEHKEVAKTCPVLMLEDSKQWISYVENSDTPMGMYVSNLIRNFDNGKSRVPWLKDYLKYIKEGTPLYPCRLVYRQQGFAVCMSKTRYHLRNHE